MEVEPAAPAPEASAFLRQDLGTARRLAPGGEHVYRLEAASEHFLHFEIEQRGVDVEVSLEDSDGPLVRVDSDTGTRHAERLYWVTTTRGPHTLTVHAFEGNDAPGHYVARLVDERPAGRRDHQVVAAEKAFADAYAAEGDRLPGELPAASVAGYRSAQAIWQDLGESRRQADALHKLATLHRVAGKLREAIDFYDRALPLLTLHADREQRAIAVNDLALAWREVGEPALAESGYEQALKLFRELGDVRNQAAVLHNLGRLARRRGRPVEALELLRQAEEQWRRVADSRQLVDTLNVLGEVYAALGEAEMALDHHHQALELLDPRSEPLDRAITLSFVGRARLEAGDLAGAAAAYGESLALREAGGDEVGQATARAGLGLVEGRRGNPRRALELYQQALAVFERRESPLRRAIVLNNLAWIYNRLGEAEQASELHQQALLLFQQIESHEGAATSLLGLARAHRQLGQVERALRHAEAALAQIERVLELGEATARADLQVPYLSSRQAYFDLYIDLLMERHRQAPAAGYDALALATSEQARARHLLAILGTAPAPGDGSPPALLERQRTLSEEINAGDRELRRRRSANPGATLAAAERRQRQRLTEYHRTVQRVREHSPWHASLRRPRPLAVAQIQQLLDDDTLLLEYHLGEDRSHLWSVSRRQLESYELPPRAEIEPLARRAYGLLMESDRITHRVPARRAMEQLADTLLTPVVERLAGRLAVVAGGALEYIPFAALPLPAAPQRPLVVEHEIVRLPSASVLAALRERAAGLTPPQGLLAVFADPVFDRDDQRLGRTRGPSTTQPSGFNRLPHSRREAEDIRHLAETHGEGSVLAALGFDAHRQRVLKGGLADYRILHFATHGVLHADHPELSSLVLSRYHADGSPREERLPLHEIYSLRLAADLVVLSACRSALGEEVRGEGLLGLPRGFLYAGAARVLVSLWNVHDESTADLMARFYRYLLVDDMSPAAALRAAQLSMLAEPRYAPAQWAAFVVQGDWD